MQANTGIVKTGFEIDLNPSTLYQMSETEKARFEEESERMRELNAQSNALDEYIFLIDRSYSMSGTFINLAKEALMLFIQSLPYGSRFNVVSYGSSHQFLFEGERSVQYDDQTVTHAINEIKQFDANLGGTEIYKPLEEIFKKPVADEVHNSHIYLLTDGAVLNAEKVIDLIKNNCTGKSRLHTFGIGSGADERLIKGCAFSGKGNFSFIYQPE